VSARPQAPRGTFDVLPDVAGPRLALYDRSRETLGRLGYSYIETPIFEDTELFARGVGDTTDIVQKEMFTFEDQGGRSLTLRPEGTAPVARAYIEHGMHKRPQPVKLWYWGPFFRYETPQAGRYRQFNQVGVEAIGSASPSMDAEVIVLLSDLLRESGARDVRLRLSSLGTPETRREYSEELRAFLRERADRLSDDVRSRIDANPLRAFDSDHPGTQAVVSEAPRLIDRIDGDDAEHFAEVRSLLDDAGVGYEVDGTLVRGLDYYTRTVFEFTSEALGAQSGVGGGGRYDLLIEQLGGPSTPGIGWAAGIERIVMASQTQEEGGAPDVYVTAQSGSGRSFVLAHAFTRAGLSAQLEQAGRSLKGQMKHADRLGARFVVIFDDDGMRVRDMSSGQEEPVATGEEAVRVVREALA
jgi:histidyl-tRNA synthetase